MNQTKSLSSANMINIGCYVVILAMIIVCLNTLSVHSADTAPTKPPSKKDAFKEQMEEHNTAKELVMKEKKYREKEKQSKLNSYNDAWSDADMMQHPIDEEPRRRNRALGEMCLYSGDCISGCCMLDRESKIRSCQPKAILGEKCTTAQIKADLYVDACPCESGDSNCVYPGEFCTK